MINKILCPIFLPGWWFNDEQIINLNWIRTCMINLDHNFSLRKLANCTETCMKTLEINQISKHYFKPDVPGFSGDFRWRRTGSWSELTEKFLRHRVKNTASMLHWFSVFYSRNRPVSFYLVKIQMFFCAFDHCKMWDIVRYCLYYERT
jgi:hypothetical protein